MFNLIIASGFKKAGRSLWIHPSARIRGQSRIKVGSKFSAERNLWLEAITSYHGKLLTPEISIGDNVVLSASVHIASVNRVKIGNNVLMASHVFISDHNHGTYKGEVQSNPRTAPVARELTHGMTVTIQDNVWIGEFVTVLPGASIGEGCVVASHSVVMGDIPPYSIIGGTPARIIKQYSFTQNQWLRVD